MKNGLFLDDLRFSDEVTWVSYPNDVTWKIVRTCEEFKEYLCENGIPQYITFDHDLGDEEPLNGAELADWLCYEVVDGRLTLPDNFQYFVHSMNPIGADNIRSKLDQLIRFMSK